DEVPAMLARARQLIDQGSPSAAVQLLAGAPAADPRVRVLRGVARYHANDPLPAIEDLAAVLPALPPDSPERREAIQVLGLSHYLAGHLGEAIPFLEQTRAFAPGNSDLAYILGMAYIQTRQPDRARETWARAFHVPADSAAAHLLAAQMMVRAEMEDMAQAELTAALKKDPRLPQANLLLGQAALFRGRLDEALALFNKELETSPGSSMAFYRMGDAYTRQLQWDKAIAALQRSVWLNPYFSGPYILMGKAYQAKGDRGAAEGMLRRAIGYDPNNKTAHYLLAQVLQQLGRVEDAKKEFDIAQRLQATTDR
ncbi:MAG TPA: tetratricopeptide repeat protein, partial [Vicinamibacteria bacterium]|nr:tetratricopeptide repeat protein [Vicinamibacteria bacterium]